MDFLLASGIFAVVFIGVLAFTSSRGTDVEQQRELARRLTRPADEIDIDVMRKRRPEEGAMLGGLYRLNLLRSLEEAMWQAGMYMRVGDMLLIIVLMFGAGLFGGNMMFHDMLIATGIGVAAGLLPLFYIQFQKKRRLKAFSNQLPFALDLIKSSLEAGPSLPTRASSPGGRVPRSAGQRVPHGARANPDRAAAASRARRHAQASSGRRPAAAGRRGARANGSRFESGADCRPALRNRAHPAALAVANSSAHRAIALWRPRRRLPADRGAIPVQPGSTELHQSVVPRSDRSEDFEICDRLGPARSHYYQATTKGELLI